MSGRRNAIRAGVDEAGLGPTLGPLVIAAFAASGARDLHLALAAAIDRPGAKPPHLEVGDSKEIHTGARKFARLERTALATWMWATGSETPPASARELIAALAAPLSDPVAPAEPAPWFAEGSALDEALPLANDPEELCRCVATLRTVAEAAGVRPTLLRADLISAASFNREMAVAVEAGGTKNTWVVSRTLALVRALAEHPASEAGLEVLCDKAGGRDDYRRPLALAFPELIAEERSRGRAESRYELFGVMDAHARVELAFAMKADRLDARVSLASCIAKYLRELTMRALNAWFAERRADLRATAGYPQDAARFIAQVEGLAEDAGLSRALWVRGR